MKSRLLSWSPLLLLIMLASLTWWLDEKIQEKTEKSHNLSAAYPDFFIEGYEATSMDSTGKLLYFLRGKKLEHFTYEKLTSLNQPLLIYHAPEGQSVSFASIRAKLENNGEVVHFEDKVRVERLGVNSESDLLITTSYLKVEAKSEIAKTNRLVNIKYGTSKLSAKGLEFDNKTGIIRLLSETRAQYDNPKNTRLR